MNLIGHTVRRYLNTKNIFDDKLLIKPPFFVIAAFFIHSNELLTLLIRDILKREPSNEHQKESTSNKRDILKDSVIFFS